MLFTQVRHQFRGPRRLGRPLALASVLAVLATLFVALLAPASPAQAVPYQFWGYYQLSDGQWDFVQNGPAESVPADGAVEGWRFAVADTSDVRVPRDVLTFTEICGATEPADGQKRVGLVIDYGRDVDAPDGDQPPEPMAQCVLVDEQASGAEALAGAGLELRAQDGLTCALDGFPAQGCGGEVGEVSEETAAADEPIEIPVTDAAAASAEGSDGAVQDDATQDAAESGGEPADDAGDAEDADRDERGPVEDTGFAVGAVVGIVMVVLVVIVAIIVALQRRRRD